MKKALLVLGCALGVIAGGLLIWNLVIPGIGFIMEQFFGFLPGLLG